MSLRANFAKQSPHRTGDCFVAKGKSTPRNDIILFFLFAFLIVSCSTDTPQSKPQIIPVYSTSAAEPWLTELYECASQQNNVVLSRVDDPVSADLVLQIGEPEFLASYAYQIDEEEILVVTHRQSPVQNLTLEEAQALFLGLGDPAVQVWVYASDTDIQQVFDRFVMEGRSVASSASIAENPQQMSDVLVNESDSVGILPRHWDPSTHPFGQSGQAPGDVRDVFSVATAPVLAITQSEPRGISRDLIACLQK